MLRRIIVSCVALTLIGTGFAYAQTGGGSLRGYARDESGAILPGVSVTAESDVIMAPEVSVTDGTGYYRIINLPPGTYALSFEMPGFATYRQEGVVLRAGANYNVDATLTISSVQETITVTAETPMLEISKPSNVINVEGEFQRQMPIQARRNWSDFLELTPGMSARPFDDGSGRMVYFGHGTEHFAHVIMVEGMNAANYADAQVTYVGMGADMVDDIEVKSGGAPAAEPLGTGLVINVVTKSGGNQFRGSVGYALQRFGMTGDNAPSGEGNFVGTPTKQQVSQLDMAIGGPIQTDKIWFFAAYRYVDLSNGISRTAREVELLQGFSGAPLGGGRGNIPVFEEFPNTTGSHQPYAKVSAQVTGNHRINGYWQNDRQEVTGNREYNYEPIDIANTGGNLFGAKLTSVFSANTTGQFTFLYNDKSRNRAEDIESLPGRGPDIIIHQEVDEDGGRLEGTGRLVQGGNIEDGIFDVRPSSMTIFRADFTHYKEGWGGSHEFQTGLFAAPKMTYDRFSRYLNDGLTVEEHVLLDPNNPQGGTWPFHQRIYDTTERTRLLAEDRDIGVYFQDTWKPNPRLTLNLGLRLDWVNRYDGIFDNTRMQNALAIGPRIGASYLLTDDARNVLRASWVRVHEQVNGRDAGTSENTSSSPGYVDQYDFDRDGVFETQFRRAPSTASVAAEEFDPSMSQPYINEWIIGFRKQFQKQFAIDVAYVDREFFDRYGQWDVNGIYPDSPGEPFIGFGLVDPDRGRVLQLTNNFWDTLKYRAIEITATQRIARKFQLMIGINRQWQKFSSRNDSRSPLGWNPTDPVRFIQPTTYASDALIYPTRGLRDDNSFDLGTTSTYGPMWRKYSIRLGGTWYAPKGIVVAASYTQLAGPWSGPIQERLSSNDPDVLKYGPSKVTSSTGSTQSNPLSTTVRHSFATRGEGQVQAQAVKTLGLKIGYTFKLGGTREFELGGSIFNILNASGFNQYTYNGANQSWNPSFLEKRNLQPPVSLQMTFVFRF